MKLFSETVPTNQQTGNVINFNIPDTLLQFHITIQNISTISTIFGTFSEHSKYFKVSVNILVRDSSQITNFKLFHIPNTC